MDRFGNVMRLGQTVAHRAYIAYHVQSDREFPQTTYCECTETELLAMLANWNREGLGKWVYILPHRVYGVPENVSSD